MSSSRCGAVWASADRLAVRSSCAEPPSAFFSAFAGGGMSVLPSAGRFPSALVARPAADGTTLAAVLPGIAAGLHLARAFLLALGQAFAFGRHFAAAVALQTRL